MYTVQPKKMLIINILDILKKYTDASHRLSQKDILELLMSEYNMKAERKAVKNNLMNLIDFGYPISYSEIKRQGKNGEEIVYTDWYMEHEFDDSELRLIIDSLLFYKNLPYSQCKKLINKLEGLSSTYFHSKVKHIVTLPDDKPANDQIFYTIDVLDEAISKRKQVSFEYNSFSTDRKLHPRKREDGTVREYIVNPYQLAAANGRYYLICNYDKYDNVSHYRVDRISNIRLLDTQAKPMKQVHGLENGFNLPKHLAEHIYMFTGDTVHVKFKARKYILNDIIDWFDRNAKFSEESDEWITVDVDVNETAMHKWALQYAEHIVVIKPENLRNSVYEGLKNSLKLYEEE